MCFVFVLEHMPPAVRNVQALWRAPRQPCLPSPTSGCASKSTGSPGRLPQNPRLLPGNGLVHVRVCARVVLCFLISLTHFDEPAPNSGDTNSGATSNPKLTLKSNHQVGADHT